MQYKFDFERDLEAYKNEYDTQRAIGTATIKLSDGSYITENISNYNTNGDGELTSVDTIYYTRYIVNKNTCTLTLFSRVPEQSLVI